MDVTSTDVTIEQHSKKVKSGPGGKLDVPERGSITSRGINELYALMQSNNS